ncbi:DEKNAAC101118 [Brettanomyces naardenensis]|uniref:DEKNAAC101118 n=1 Tax=Brettanomyces naardenensis TaxID=13370 RepID=A0A448YHD5_BRENA|nr:DEKNAAC101118 [Brettanomyces naardenensis]
MDGLLINSEELYTQSFSEVLRRFGREQGLTWDVKVKLQGLQGPEACQVLVDEYDLGDVTNNLEMFRLTSEAQGKLWPTVQFLPGALELLKYLHSKKVPIALCTSSNYDKYEMKTTYLKEGFNAFGDNIITGDHPDVIGKGKPLPYVWWAGLDKINKDRADDDKIKPEECLVFEDAVSGFISGKRSKAYVIWVPDERGLAVMDKTEIAKMIGENSRYGLQIKSLLDFEPSKFGL